uniref:Uncharacterized protein n=1 Tax=Aegilops tauschii TaxID=37682 RepID=N1QU87_AEGTA
MGSRYEVEVTVGSARDLKNVNWRNGDLQPYAVLWVDDGPKCSSRVDLDNGESPVWDEKLTVPLPPSTARLEDAVLRIDVVHANAGGGTKPLVGSDCWDPPATSSHARKCLTVGTHLVEACGASYLEDKIEDDVAEKVEDDLAGGGYDDDDY